MFVTRGPGNLLLYLNFRAITGDRIINIYARRLSLTRALLAYRSSLRSSLHANCATRRLAASVYVDDFYGVGELYRAYPVLNAEKRLVLWHGRSWYPGCRKDPMAVDSSSRACERAPTPNREILRLLPAVGLLALA